MEEFTSVIPSAANCSVDPWDDLVGVVLAPSSPDPLAISTVTIVIRNSANSPISNATVVATFADGPELCGEQDLFRVTDEQGTVELPIYGGACVQDTPFLVTVKANGVTVRNFEQVKSPDFDGSAANGAVDISDLLEFKRGFLESLGSCHDYDNDGNVGLSDLLIFGPAFTRGLACEN